MAMRDLPRPDLLSRVKRTYELTPQLRKARIEVAKLKKHILIRDVRQGNL